MVHNWLYRHNPITVQESEEPVPYNPKCPDVPTIPTGRFPPPSSSWENFPSRELPAQPTTPINVPVLEEIVSKYENRMSNRQYTRAKASLTDMVQGALAPLRIELPPIRVNNSPTVSAHNKDFSDTVAWWIRQGYVAGPFRIPPLENFRANSMIAVEQKGKVRPIMNLSVPEGESFNDAVDDDKLDTVTMSLAWQFGYSVMECGIGARLWKLDWTDAYKNVPVAMSQLKYQGFFWN